MFAAPVRLYRRAAYCFGSESIYPGFTDRVKGVLLRLAAEPRRGKLLKGSGRTYSVRLRDLPSPVYVRRGTSDFLVLRDIFEDGEYEQAELFNLPADARILDMGGNIGMSVLYFSRLCPQSQLIGVEPDPDNLRMMEMNCRGLIDAKRATLVRAFIAASDGQAGIDRSDDAWGFKKTDGPAPAGGETVPCISIPTLLAKSGWDRIDLLKCDIEGAEKEVFAGCDPWIGKVQHLIVETHPPYTPDNLFADLKRVGWNYKIVHQNLYTPSPRIFLSRSND
jgi:FkbM family methyltransferase